MAAAALWARSLIRRHRRATVALALLFGLAFGFIGAAFAAERRADGALGRYLSTGTRYDATVMSCPPGVDPEDIGDDFGLLIETCLSDGAARAAAADLAAMPEVAAATYGSFHVVGVLDPGAPNGWGRLGLLSSTKTPGAGFTDGQPILLEGRLPRPGTSNEIVASESTARDGGLEVGDVLTVASWAPDEVDLATQGGLAPTLPPVELRVVGIGRFPDDLSRSPTEDASGNQLPGTLFASGGSSALFRGFAGYGHAPAVQLRGDVQGFEEALGARWSDRFFQVDGSLDIDEPGLEQVIDNERRAVMVVIAIALAATVGFAGLTLVRQVAREQAERPTLAVLGFSRRDLAAAAALRASAIAVPAAVVAVLTTAALSPIGPVGLARRADPDLGFHIDALACAAVAAGVVVLVVAAGAVVPLLLPMRPVVRERRTARLAPLAQRLGPEATTGLSLAAVGWRRVAAAVTAVAVCAVVAAGVTVGSLDRVFEEPVRYGAWWDVTVGDYSDPDAVAADAAVLAALPEVEAAAGIVEQSGIATVDGRRTALMASDPYEGSPQPTVTEGRAPTGTDEIALGRGVMRDVGAHIGDTVVLAPSAAGTASRPRRMLVTGEVVLDNPVQQSVGAGDAAYVHVDVLNSISASVAQQIAIRFAPGIERAAAIRDLAEVYPGSIHPVAAPDDLRNLRPLRSVAWVIAGLLGILAAATLVHAIVTMVSVNRRSLAVLAVLGARRSQRSHVAMWAVAPALLGAVAMGIAAGVVVGRALWRSLAEGLGIPGDPMIALAAPALAALVTLAGGQAVAWLAVRRLSARTVAPELRA